jgi:hypothetical protein
VWPIDTGPYFLAPSAAAQFTMTVSEDDSDVVRRREIKPHS